MNMNRKIRFLLPTSKVTNELNQKRTIVCASPIFRNQTRFKCVIDESGRPVQLSCAVAAVLLFCPVAIAHRIPCQTTAVVFVCSKNKEAFFLVVVVAPPIQKISFSLSQLPKVDKSRKAPSVCSALWEWKKIENSAGKQPSKGQLGADASFTWLKSLLFRTIDKRIKERPRIPPIPVGFGVCKPLEYEKT